MPVFNMIFKNEKTKITHNYSFSLFFLFYNLKKTGDFSPAELRYYGKHDLIFTCGGIKNLEVVS